MSSTRHDLHFLFTLKLVVSLLVEHNHRLVQSADDEQCGRLDLDERLSSQIQSPAAAVPAALAAVCKEDGAARTLRQNQLPIKCDFTGRDPYICRPVLTCGVIAFFIETSFVTRRSLDLDAAPALCAM
jgi:hypothetical protein